MSDGLHHPSDPARSRSVIFLDVDGVLNQCGRNQDVVTDKAMLLRRIVAETGCSIVVSSTWRLYDELRDRLVKLLHASGVAIADWTPCVDTHTESGLYTPRERGEEIQAWLDEHADVNRFVILDDQSDMAHLATHLVRTDSSIGLTEALADEVIRRLK